MINFSTLTLRELEIMDLLSKGFTMEEMALEKSISYVTVKSHLTNIYQKTFFSRNKAHPLTSFEKIKLVIAYLQWQGRLK